MQPLQPKDYVALVTLVGVLLYKLTGHNGGLDAILTLIIGYYFGHRDSGIDPGR